MENYGKYTIRMFFCMSDIQEGKFVTIKSGFGNRYDAKKACDEIRKLNPNYGMYIEGIWQPSFEII